MTTYMQQTDYEVKTREPMTGVEFGQKLYAAYGRLDTPRIGDINRGEAVLFRDPRANPPGGVSDLTNLFWIETPGHHAFNDQTNTFKVSTGTITDPVKLKQAVAEVRTVLGIRK